MAKVGRFFCVALPFILTLLSLILLLVACLSGVTNKGLYMFQVNMRDFSIDPNKLGNLKNLITRDVGDVTNDLLSTAKEKGGDILEKIKGEAGGSGAGSHGNNLTAADLGLKDYYDISLWGYCTTDSNGKRECQKPKYNWAAQDLNTSIIEQIEQASKLAGHEVNVPDDITKAIEAFGTFTKWTEIAFMIALVALGVQLLFGIFATCTRVLSCVTFIVSGVSSLAVIAAASLSTAMSVIVVGAVEASAKFYGLDASFNTTFLALVWASAAFALGAGFFWLFTICCCAPDRRRDTKRHSDTEKLLPTGAYQPLGEHHGQGGGLGNGYYNNAQHGGPRYPSGAHRSDLAYEPFSHRG